jgi:hypothetical protein
LILLAATFLLILFLIGDNTEFASERVSEIAETYSEELVVEDYTELLEFDEYEETWESAMDELEVDEVASPNEVSAKAIIESCLGNDTIEVEGSVLERYDLPSLYYPSLDYSSFQPYMDYRTITSTGSASYSISHSVNAYTDEVGLRRYEISEGQINIDGKDDYIIALGTFYKERGTAGSRYLIVTSTGMYTAIAGDEKSDVNTDIMNMCSSHGNGKAGLIEWIVDANRLDKNITLHGTITAGPVEELTGEILYIYKIN